MREGERIFKNKNTCSKTHLKTRFEKVLTCSEKFFTYNFYFEISWNDLIDLIYRDFFVMTYISVRNIHVFIFALCFLIKLLQRSCSFPSVPKFPSNQWANLSLPWLHKLSQEFYSGCQNQFEVLGNDYWGPNFVVILLK